MSAGAEDDDALAARARQVSERPNLGLVAPHPETPAEREIRHRLRLHHDGVHGAHHILLEPEEDRWKWRRRIRQNPRQLFVYRIAVGIAGLLLICLGVVSGPLPGPGGIPLVLLGLAVWSSEFEWAYRVMQWFKSQVHRYRGWNASRKVVFWVIFFACCGLAGYLYLLVVGVPVWMPATPGHWLTRLPGVN